MTFTLKQFLLSRHRAKQNESDFTLFVLLPLNDRTVQIGLREPKSFRGGTMMPPKRSGCRRRTTRIIVPQAVSSNVRAASIAAP
jgi:hypothetical protein